MEKVKFLLLSLFFIASNSWASTLNLDLTGGVARWDNAINISGDSMVPSFWTPTQGLTPTDKWIPGGFVTLPPETITLYSGDESIDLPISFIGFQYHTGNAATKVGDSASGGSSCGSWSSPIATVEGQGCIFPNILTTDEVVTPYAFIRPIFKIDSEALALTFDGQPSGIYSGSVWIDLSYQFYLGDIKTKFIDSQPFVLQINHTPAFITSVDVTEPLEMETVYGIGSDDVSAKTSVDVTATGYFSNGLKVMLKAGDVYELIGPDAASIPYSLKCVGNCDEAFFVNNEGEVVNRTIKVTGDDNFIFFQIDIEFDSTPLDPLTVGEYIATFTLIFEPDV